MNMMYKDEILYINLIGDTEFLDINIIKNRIFSILDQYGINNIEIFTNSNNITNKKIINKIKKEYLQIYKGNFKVV